MPIGFCFKEHKTHSCVQTFAALTHKLAIIFHQNSAMIQRVRIQGDVQFGHHKFQ